MIRDSFYRLFGNSGFVADDAGSHIFGGFLNLSGNFRKYFPAVICQKQIGYPGGYKGPGSKRSNQ
jgi:hypothetical protein